MKKKLWVWMPLFFVSCQTTEKNVHKISNENISYLSFVREKLPHLSEGLSLEEVQSYLEVDSRFHGIILTEGEEKSYDYLYYIDSYELKLTFDFKKDKKGYLSKYNLRKVTEKNLLDL